jgi:hypothetical protein
MVAGTTVATAGVTGVAEISVDCPTCDIPIPVKVTFGEGDNTGFPASVLLADYLAAHLEHALRKGTSHE